MVFLMNASLPSTTSRELHFENGSAIGISNRWQQGQYCSILTTAPNELMSPIHDRMPVIIAPESFARWLDPAVIEVESLAPLYAPFPAGELEAYEKTRDEIRQVLEIAAARWAEGKAVGKAEGEAAGRIAAILAVLAARNIAVSVAARARVEAQREETA